jgi:hypothetical protein
VQPKPRLCPKCSANAELTRHHVYPRRHFRHDDNEIFRHTIFWFCRGCHDKIEVMIPYERQHLTFYWEVIGNFLGAAA